jgi:hypothetical protein
MAHDLDGPLEELEHAAADVRRSVHEGRDAATDEAERELVGEVVAVARDLQVRGEGRGVSD